MKTPLCVECSTQSPQTASHHTLMGFGWRLSRVYLPSGEVSIEWRCGDCFKKRKRPTDRNERM